MNQLNLHNHELKNFFDSIFEEVDLRKVREMVDLDSIDIVLRKCLSIEEMREAGSFFTGQKLSSETVHKFRRAITSNSVILDPTCGAGNLLIECSRQLGVSDTLSSTLKIWGKVLRGYDIHESFVEAAKLRLILEALNRGSNKDCSLDEALQYLNQIKVADAMTIREHELKDITHAVMNPPFTLWPSPKKDYWKVGKVNAAGVVIDHFLRYLPKGCEVSAILPDVLRSGSRYENFRAFVSSILDGDSQIFGRFNSKTDVDVFILRGVISNELSDIEWAQKLSTYVPLSEHFDVCIGPLVAYRDPLLGPSYPFVHSKNAPVWGIMKEFTEYRQFSGRAIKPPFVVVRRTSSPTDKYRASATIVTGKELVAIENHLIVIKPKSSTMRDCNRLIKHLKSQQTNDFLNERIRLRHLTVGVVKAIPIWQD